MASIFFGTLFFLATVYMGILAFGLVFALFMQWSERR